jgi:hypothetical protein
MDGHKQPAAIQPAAITEQTVEQTLDSAVDALIALDAPLLSQLAEIWGAWEITPWSVTVSQAERERLEAKLLLLARLLRQTEISLSLLGLPARGCSPLQPGHTTQYPFEPAYRGM